MATEDESDALTDRERARIRHRERKQHPRMVVDNAGVKRVLLALAGRRKRQDSIPPKDPGNPS